MSKNIFEIAAEYNKIIGILYENGGEITPELEEALNLSELELDKKLQSYNYLIKNTEAQIEIIKEEKKRLDAMIKSCENLIEKTKSRVIETVDIYGELTSTGKSKQIKLDTMSATIVDKTVYEVKDNFNDDRFMKFEFKKLPANVFNQIKNTLDKNNIEYEGNATIDKAGINSFMKDNPNVEIEGIERKIKKQLTLR
jgi:hypothetical protein